MAPEENRIALVGLIVEDPEATAVLNRVLHEYSDYIVGRMGIPYRQHGVCIISVVFDAPGNVLSAVSGKLGMIPGVRAKTLSAGRPGKTTPQEE